MFNEDKNKKTNLYMAEKIKNKIASEIKIKEGLNKYNGIKDTRYLFNDNIYKVIKDIRYLFNGIAFNEDYHIEHIKSEFIKLSNNLVNGYSVRYKILDIWWIILITVKNLKKDPLI